MQTTLNKIKLHTPCGLSQPKNIQKGWGKLLNHLGKTEADDEALELRTILESNGIDDTIWAFRAVEGKDKEIGLFSADCAELVLPIFEKQYPNDDRPRRAIQAARDYGNGFISAEELIAARDAAWDAARDVAWAATAAGDVAWAATAAGDAASAALAARDAAWAAASRAARYAAWDAANEIKYLLIKYI
jgi:hypothetical protein